MKLDNRAFRSTDADQVRLLRTKLKVLASQKKSSKARVEDDLDESLLVEGHTKHITVLVRFVILTHRPRCPIPIALPH